MIKVAQYSCPAAVATGSNRSGSNSVLMNACTLAALPPNNSQHRVHNEDILNSMF